MTANAIALKAAAYLLPFLKKSKLIEQIGDDFTEAISTELQMLWKKVKPIFIQDFNDGDGKLKPAVETAAVVEFAIENAAQNDTLATELREILTKLDEKAAVAGIQITNSKNVIAGVQNLHVGGDFRQGDSNTPL